MEEIPTQLIDNELPFVPKREEYAPKTYYSQSAEQSYYPQRPRTAQTKKASAPFSFGEAPQRSAPKGNLSLKEGDRVFHITFGEGEILSARQMGGDVLYEVIFDKVGTKKLMGTYARLKKID